MNLFRKIFGDDHVKPLKLYQLHEHLSIMSTGVSAFVPSDTLRNACLQAAKNTWHLSGLSRWSSRRREAQHCYKCGDNIHGYLHINADHENCFFIIIFEITSSTPIGYILFDIGSEYSQLIYICPSIDFEGVPTESIIEESIPQLSSHKDSFAILDAGNGSYIQAFQQSAELFTLEHQLVNTSNHYRATGDIDARQVIEAFKSYAFEKKEWTTNFKWEKMDL